ncbi:MAG TPA: hypothetical protein VF954_07095 [Acidimicrobiales bacterium]
MSPVYRLLLRTLTSRARLVAMGFFALLPVIVAVAIRARPGADRGQAGFALIDAYGLSLLAPVTALAFASAALGDLVDDRTLVYIWLRPLPTWQLAGAALGATLTIAVPLTVVPLVAAAAISGAGGSLVSATAASSAVAVVGYGSVFLTLGLRVQRALVWGLAYVLIWEGAVGRTARGAARLSIGIHARSLLAHLDHHSLPKLSTSAPVAVFAPLAAAAAAVALTVRWLATADVA